MLLNYSLQKRAMAIYENKHTSDRAKVAAMDQLNKEHEAGMNAILTPEQRKTLASLRSLQSKMQSEPAAQR